MKKIEKQEYVPRVGDHLKSLVKIASFGGLFFSLSGTMFIWAGIDSFHCSAIIWKASLAFNLFVFVLTWIIYLPFRHTDRLLGNGLLAIFVLFNLFWMVGFSGFYFYFLFAPINILTRVIALSGVTAILLHRAYVIYCDIKEAFNKNKNLFNRMYCDDGVSITFSRKAIRFLEKARRERNPFKSVHLYAAVFLTPFVLILNRLLTPVFGDGHAVFMFSAFFSVPILQWGVEIFVQTIMVMIHYPIKLQQATGKPVLLKDW